MAAAVRFHPELRFDGAASLRAEAARERALWELGERVRARSVAVAPLRSGAMIASAGVAVEGNTVRVGYAAPYALRQHEDTSLRHRGGRRAKFLSGALEATGVAREVARIYAEALK